MLSRVPPQNLEAEQATLGAMLVEREAIIRVADELTEPDFYSPQHQMLYRAMLELFREKQPVDLVTLQARLHDRDQLEAVGGVAYLVQLQDAAPTAAAVAAYAAIVREKAVRRALIQLGGQLQEGAQGQLEVAQAIEAAQRRLFELGARRERPWRPLSELAVETFEDMDQQSKQDRHVLGISTGLPDVDTWLSGLQPAHIYVIGGYPSLGKTALALQLAVTAAEAGQTVLVFSVEMWGKALVRRYFASKAKIDLGHVTRALLRDEEWERLTYAADAAQRLALWVTDQGGLTVTDVHARTRRLAADHKLGLVVVDYLQLLTKRDDNEELTEAMNGLRAMANELQVPILVLSQLSRQHDRTRRRPLPRPVLSDLRGSGSIEQVADVVIFLHDPREDEEQLDNSREFIIAKQRNGPTALLELHWDRRQQRFSCTAQRELDGVS